VSGQPALKSAQVTIRPFPATWYGFGVSTDLVTSDMEYFAKRPLDKGMAFECASSTLPNNWTDFVAALFPNCEMQSSVQGADPAQFRCVALKDGLLSWAFFASPEPVLATREWLQQQLGKPVKPLAILAGRPVEAGEDQGPILCACMNVGRHVISRCIANTPGMKLHDICAATGAGTGCGSCRIEVQRILSAAVWQVQAAE
jgi:assimilatory nitrate reductase catalytic subunit